MCRSRINLLHRLLRLRVHVAVFIPAIAAINLTAAPVVSVPRLTHPGAGRILYFVLADRFANGSTVNDRGGFDGGPNDHGFDPTVISHFHGGDFQGLTAKLDYLKDLGVTGIWVTPPFKNKPVQEGTAGYHGYWITDFLQIDPHLGTNDEYRTFVAEAHARGIRVYMDIIVNHTADVIGYQRGDYDYVDLATTPDRDVNGRPFLPADVAYNGLVGTEFPALNANRSFAYVPFVPNPDETEIKNPAWLNDLTLYHNRGNTTFTGENSLYGDFVGLDDLYTENPRVVEGFIEIYKHWIEDYGVDGFRIDTAKHVNLEFWQAFSPAIREFAAAQGRPDFISFGEVSSGDGNAEFLSEFSTIAPIDTTLDFGLFEGAKEFISRGLDAGTLARRFEDDDYYTDHDSNVHSTVTFLGNHDAGRFAWFLEQDNPEADDATLLELSRLGHGLLFLARGQPTVYYGDEQGMVGTGNDMRARETMFASITPLYRDARLLGTDRTGADEKFDPTHPLYRLIQDLSNLRKNHRALSTGSMIMRDTGNAHVLAFSRIERTEQVEYLAALNNSRSESVTVSIPTSQPDGARLLPLFDSRSMDRPTIPSTTAGDEGRVRVTLAPLQCAVWRAAAALPKPQNGPAISIASPASNAVLSFSAYSADGQTFVRRQEFSASVAGSDGFAEVTFTLVRGSRPDQVEYLGTDDTPPYRVFWRPPADLADEEKLTVIATVDDLRGHRASTEVQNITVASDELAHGIRGSTVPIITRRPARAVTLARDATVFLHADATGTEPLEFQWIKDGRELPGATDRKLAISETGRYTVLVRNRAGAALSPETTVRMSRSEMSSTGRLENHPAFPSRYVPPRQVDVWLPPGYDTFPAKRFPVIYAQDGQNLFDPATSYGGVPWAMDRAMEHFIAETGSDGAIVVGIWNTGSERASEYMPAKAVLESNPVNILDGVVISADSLRSDAYLQFLVNELKPHIDRTYRTKAGREDTYLLGSSMGGLVSLYGLLEFPEVFGGAACLSTHWPAGDGIVVDYLSRNLPTPGRHRLYFDLGTEGLDGQYEPFQARVDDILRAAGFDCKTGWLTRRFPGADHSESSWRQRAEIPIAHLLSHSQG